MSIISIEILARELAEKDGNKAPTKNQLKPYKEKVLEALERRQPIHFGFKIKCEYHAIDIFLWELNNVHKKKLGNEKCHCDLCTCLHTGSYGCDCSE